MKYVWLKAGMITSGIALGLTGCISDNGKAPSKGQISASGSSTSATTAQTSSTTSTSTTNTNTGTGITVGLSGMPEISNVSIQADTNGSSTATMFFNAATGKPAISKYCNVIGGTGSTSRPCLCQFTWNEVNRTGSNPVTVKRQVETNIITLQDYVAVCQTPNPYLNGEIEDGAQVNVRIIPNYLNAILVVNPYVVTKQSGTILADFTGFNGLPFLNVLRYSCYERFKKGMAVKSKIRTVTDSNNVPKKVVMASEFCTASADGSAGGEEGCESAGIADYSAETYYYSLYIKSSERGGINDRNDRYSCPRVNETLYGKDTVGANAQTFYPMDRTFALAQVKTAEFNLGVIAPSVLGDQSDPASAPQTSCEPPKDGAAPSEGGSNSSISNRCLGYAMKPKPNGTCGTYKDANGNVKQTYRLRRFVSVSPASHSTTGKTVDEALALDVEYVLDRPVIQPDTSKVYSIYGPKSCPYAFFDHAGVRGKTVNGKTLIYNGGLPGYSASSSNDWKEKSVDGIAFPNVDIFDNKTASCSAVFPIVKYTAQNNPQWVSLGTSHASNKDATSGLPNAIDVGGGRKVAMDKIYVRPVIDPWYPHKVEDTSFQACAPQADTIIDPPLHFTKMDDGNVAWCAETVPSAVDAVEELDRKHQAVIGDKDFHPGYVVPFTSHVAKGTASVECKASIPFIPSGWPEALDESCSIPADPTNVTVLGAARHPASLFVDKKGALPVCANKTCDRTVINTGDGSWKKFPLLAPPSELEAVLKKDPAYGCLISQDGGTGKKDKISPADGCCSKNIVYVQTGPSGSVTEAHLEPDKKCGTPNLE